MSSMEIDGLVVGEAWSKQTYDHFRYVDVIVLPKCEQKEIDELEARLQIERDIKSAYSWHAQATMLKTKQRLNNYTTTELATYIA